MKWRYFDYPNNPLQIVGLLSLMTCDFRKGWTNPAECIAKRAGLPNS